MLDSGWHWLVIAVPFAAFGGWAAASWWRVHHLKANRTERAHDRQMREAQEEFDSWMGALWVEFVAGDLTTSELGSEVDRYMRLRDTRLGRDVWPWEREREVQETVWRMLQARRDRAAG